MFVFPPNNLFSSSIKRSYSLTVCRCVCHPGQHTSKDGCIWCRQNLATPNADCLSTQLGQVCLCKIQKTPCTCNEIYPNNTSNSHQCPADSCGKYLGICCQRWLHFGSNKKTDVFAEKIAVALRVFFNSACCVVVFWEYWTFSNKLSFFSILNGQAAIPVFV